MQTSQFAARIDSRGTANRRISLLLVAVALAGCKSGGFTYYSSPRVTGRVLAADTRHPVANVKIKRIVPRQSQVDDSFGPPKGGQLMQQPPAVRTDADGRFVLNSERLLAFFMHSGWYSVTLSFTHTGYSHFQTNYTVADVSSYSSEGAPIVNAGEILLNPVPQ